MTIRTVRTGRAAARKDKTVISVVNSVVYVTVTKHTTREYLRGDRNRLVTRFTTLVTVRRAHIAGKGGGRRNRGGVRSRIIRCNMFRPGSLAAGDVIASQLISRS